jgi:hypothetical protein
MTIRPFRIALYAASFALAPSGANATAPPEAFGRPMPDGKAASLKFPDGAVLVKPLRVSAGRDPRCLVQLTSAEAPPQLVLILPTPAEATADAPPTVCLGLKGFGRVPASDGMERIGFIYRAFTGDVLRPDNSFDAPRVLFRTPRDPRWRLDEVLGRSLEERQVRTIAAMRKMLSAR